MFPVLVRILEILALLWLIRYLWNVVVGDGFFGHGPGQAKRRGFFSRRGNPPSEPRVITGEMKRDPQCGTYVSTELSFKSRLGGEELHFCSRECQQAFLQAGSGKSA